MSVKTVSQSEPARNTDGAGTTSARPSNNQLYRWCFTLQYPGEPGEPVEPRARVLADTLREFCKKFIFQLEEGEGGYKHWQGTFSLKVKHRLTEVKNIIGDNTVHLEPTRNLYAAENYCKKGETRIAGPYCETSVFIDTINKDKFYPWQKSVWEELTLVEPNDRKIVWIYDENGNCGKTAFCKYMAVHHNAVIMNNGASKDIAYAIGNDPKIVMFNYTRTVEGRLNYGILESIKDGMMFSSKYESRMKIFNAPHVIVMANFLPDVNSMSLDRWMILEIKDKALVALDALKLRNDNEI